MPSSRFYPTEVLQDCLNPERDAWAIALAMREMSPRQARFSTICRGIVPEIRRHQVLENGVHLFAVQGQGDLSPLAPSIKTSVLLLNTSSVAVWRARRARSHPTAQASGARLPGLIRRAPNAGGHCCSRDAIGRAPGAHG